MPTGITLITCVIKVTYYFTPKPPLEWVDKAFNLIRKVIVFSQPPAFRFIKLCKPNDTAHLA
jgi:hypothetical protein